MGEAHDVRNLSRPRGSGFGPCRNSGSVIFVVVLLGAIPNLLQSHGFRLIRSLFKHVRLTSPVLELPLSYLALGDSLRTGCQGGFIFLLGLGLLISLKFIYVFVYNNIINLSIYIHISLCMYVYAFKEKVGR